MTNNPPSKRPGIDGRSSSGRKAPTDLEGASRQPGSAHPARGKDFTLSPEERRIVGLILAGYTNKAIARQFSLGESTIYRRTAQIIRKLRVANKFELVLFAINHRIVNQSPEEPS